MLDGQEITSRLTNILTSRVGGIDPNEWGTLAGQVVSGSSPGNNIAFSGGSDRRCVVTGRADCADIAAG